MSTLPQTDVQPLKVLRGLNGQLEVYPDRLVIRRKWGLSNLTLVEQEKVIYPQQIASIQCFEGRFQMYGTLRITLKEGGEHTLWFAFDQKQACRAREVKKLIEDFVGKNEPYAPAVNA